MVGWVAFLFRSWLTAMFLMSLRSSSWILLSDGFVDSLELFMQSALGWGAVQCDAFADLAL